MEDEKLKFCLTCDATTNIADGLSIHTTIIIGTGVLVADVLERCLLADVSVFDSDVVCSTCYQHLEDYSTLEFKFRELKNLLWMLHRETSIRRGNNFFIRGVEVQTDGMTLSEYHTDHAALLQNNTSCTKTFKIDLNSESDLNSKGDDNSEDNGNITVDADPAWHTDDEAANEGNESLECSDCGLVLPSNDALRVHQLVFRHFGGMDSVPTECDMEVKPRVARLCKLCGGEYVGFIGLKKHMAIHHAALRLKFKCRFCDAVLRSQPGAHYHGKMHSYTSSELHKCFEFIADSGPNSTDGADHVVFDTLSHEDESDDSDEPLARRKDFRSLRINHPIKTPNDVNANAKQALSELKKINGIQIRKIPAHSKKKKKKNTKSNPNLPSVQIAKKKRDSETEFDMAAYMKKREQMNTKRQEASDEGDDKEFEIPPNKEPKHECEICHKKWRTKGELKGHMSAHSDVRPFICEICGQGYKQKKGLEIHIKMHNGVFPFQCRHCKKTFTQKGSLQRHIQIHTGEKPHQCELCGKRFLHLSSFNIHTMGHTGERPIPCKVCSARVRSRSHLIRHMRIHSGEKPYECTTCGKSFAEKYNLVAHQRIHDPNPQTPGRQKKKHMCRLCSSVFTSAPKLELHVSQDHVKTVIQLAGAS